MVIEYLSKDHSWLYENEVYIHKHKTSIDHVIQPTETLKKAKNMRNENLNKGNTFIVEISDLSIFINLRKIAVCLTKSEF